MSKILLALIAALSIGFAAVCLPVGSGLALGAAGVATARIGTTAGASQARVLQPGSRGNVVEI